VSVVLGVPLALVFARYDFPGKPFVRALAVLPMVLPPVVGGVGLLAAFGRRGLVGRPLAEATGITLPFTPGRRGARRDVRRDAVPDRHRRVRDCGWSTGGSRTPPRRWAPTGGRSCAGSCCRPLWPSLAAGMALCWARALGEFGATITFAGNLPGRTQTMPLAVYLELERNPEAAYLLSFILLAVSVAVLVALRDRFLSTT
jgi:molybdate transport system permease protein